eukprot:scaffold176131_cov19-Tisochrysis_lutea.AAC.2
MGSHTKKTSGQIGRVHLSSSSKLWGTEAASGTRLYSFIPEQGFVLLNGHMYALAHLCGSWSGGTCTSSHANRSSLVTPLSWATRAAYSKAIWTCNSTQHECIIFSKETYQVLPGNTFPALYGVTDCFSNKSSSLCNTLLASGRALHYVRVSAAPCSAESKC